MLNQTLVVCAVSVIVTAHSPDVITCQGSYIVKVVVIGTNLRRGHGGPVVAIPMQGNRLPNVESVDVITHSPYVILGDDRQTVDVVAAGALTGSVHCIPR